MKKKTLLLLDVLDVLDVSLSQETGHRFAGHSQP